MRKRINRTELAGYEIPTSWHSYFKSLLPLSEDESDIEILDLIGRRDEKSNFVAFKDNQLIAMFFSDAQPVAVSRAWASTQLLSRPEGPHRHRLLAGIPGADMPEKGAIICACMNVGVNDIRDAIHGTNCGSCMPEIRAILKEVQYESTE